MEISIYQTAEILLALVVVSIVLNEIFKFPFTDFLIILVESWC